MKTTAPRAPSIPASPDEVRRRLRAVVTGDSSAVTWLFKTFAPGLLRRLDRRYSYPGGPEPEDLLQDAFVFYLQRDAKVLADFMDRVPPARQTAAALEQHLWDLACGIASNRRRSAARAKIVPINAEVRRSPEAGSERQTIDRDTLERLDRCLEKSGTRIYLYFTLRYRDGLSPAEIVQVTGWSKKAAYKLKQKVDQAARQCAEQLELKWT